MMILTIALIVPSVSFTQEKRREDEKRDEYREKRGQENKRDEDRERRGEGKTRDEDRGRLGERREDRGHLVGRWYKDGKLCEIASTRDGFEVRNERGESSRLVYDRDGSVRALDWEGGLRGEIRGNRIVWANGTSWTR